MKTIQNPKKNLKVLILPVVLASLSVMMTACNSSSSAATTTVPATASTNYCSDTTKLAFEACNADALESVLIAEAVCGNIGDDTERATCLADSVTKNDEEIALCTEQQTARTEVCTTIGEARYDPEIDPINFVNPLDIGTTVAENTYFPLVPGIKRVYESDDETVTVTVLNETIEIAGVTCIVVRDIVEENGELVEDTFDWYAQDLDGNVWYFGEIARNYEDGILTDVDGSWKHGVDGAQAGILMQAMPEVGQIYRQEWLLAEAEDMAEVISLSATESTVAASCAGTCLQTHEFTPVEPEVSESKFYAPGIGPIVVFDDDDPANREVLVEFSVD